MTCKDGRFNTGNKVCSNDLRDLNDNSIIVDGYVNSQELYIEDRLGVERLTLAGIQNKSDKQYDDIQERADTQNTAITDRADSTISKFEGEIDAIIKDAGGVEVVGEFGDSPEKVISQKKISEHLGQDSEGNTVIKSGSEVFTLPDDGGELAIKPADNIFGAGGMKLLVGGEYRDHQGFGGLVEVGSNLIYIYRIGNSHAISNNSKVMAMLSMDKGETWSSPELLYTSPNSDARPDPPKLMANGRIGFFVNRQSEDKTHYSPLFMYSDDGGISFTETTVPLNPPYTFQAVGGLLDFPTSQGGNDALGFTSFGFAAGGVMDALTTINNGETWSSVKGVAELGLDITGLSENMGIRVGVQDKWIFACRAKDSNGWRKELVIYTTDNLLSWGKPKSSGISLGGGNPPCLVYDNVTNSAHLLTVTRGRSRSVDGYESNLLIASVDADLLYDNDGSFSESNAIYRHTAYLPYWATGYMYPIKVGNRYMTQVTCGEPSDSGGKYGYTILCGDFLVGGMEQSRLFYLSQQHTRNIKTLQFRGEDNKNEIVYSIDGIKGIGNRGSSFNIDSSHDAFSYVPIIETGLPKGYVYSNKSRVHAGIMGSDWSAITTHSPTTAKRNHIEFISPSGVVGSISTEGDTASFNTTSDERLKEFSGLYSGEEAIEIIKRNPVKNFTWLSTGKSDIGWSAQESYSVSKRLANPPIHEEDRWSVDKSNRIEVMWAALDYLIQGVLKEERDTE